MNRKLKARNVVSVLVALLAVSVSASGFKWNADAIPDRSTWLEPYGPDYRRLFGLSLAADGIVMVKELYPVTINSTAGYHVLAVTYRIHRPSAAGGGNHNSKTFGIEGALVQNSSGTGFSAGTTTVNGHSIAGFTVTDENPSTSVDYSVYINLGTGALSPPGILNCYKNSLTWSGGSPLNTTAYPKFDLHAYELGDAAIDSRRAYGKANSSGSTSENPNWDRYNLNFGDYKYRGGLFAGYMPYWDPVNNKTDRSGTARTQFWVPSGAVHDSNTLFVTLTLLDMGAPLVKSTSQYGGGGTTVDYAALPDLRAYVVADDSPNLSETESTATWDKRWKLYESGMSGDEAAPCPNPPTTPDYAGGEDRETGGVYVNWPVTDTSGDYNVTPDYTHGVILALYEEDEASTVSWRYFASTEYQGESGLTFPFSCSRPRLWAIQDTTTEWTP